MHLFLEIWQPKEQFVWDLFKFTFHISCVTEKVHLYVTLTFSFASTFCHKHKGFKCVRNLTTIIVKALSALQISPRILQRLWVSYESRNKHYEGFKCEGYIVTNKALNAKTSFQNIMKFLNALEILPQTLQSL